MTEQKGLKLLYAEDDTMIRDGYLTYFKTLFENVYEASDGLEAYELYKQHNPDILILDINMPKLDGLSVTEKIRQENSDTPIIILSAYKDEEKLLRAIPLGLVRYLIKPVKKSDLDSVLFSVLDELQTTKNNHLTKNAVTWNRDLETLSISNKKIHLTRNEIIFMNLLSSGAQISYSLDDILSEFWQLLPHKEMTHNSIRNIIKRLKAKLPENCIENHYGIGYKLCIIF